MSVKLENIDELRRRTNVSYEVAKEALEKCNDDLVEAIIYLEKQNMVKPEQAAEQKNSFWDTVKRIIKKGNNTKLIIKKKENIILSVPVTAAVILTIIAPYVTLIGLLIVLFTGHRIKFEGKKGECTQVNEILNKVADTVDSTKTKLTEED
jgi:NACalpha-BTF3-like transcription factor